MITNSWVMLGIFFGCAALAVALGTKTKIGSAIGGPIIALVLGMILVNCNIMPGWADVHSVIFSYLINIAVPLLLFKVNLKNLSKLGGKILIAFALGTVGTMIGAVIAGLTCGVGAETWKAYGMFAATYIGGSVNLASVGNGLGVDGSIWTAVSAADAIIFVVYMIFLMSFANWKFTKKHYKLSTELGYKIQLNEEKVAKKEESHFGIAITIGAAVAIAAVGEWIGGLLNVPGILFSTAIALVVAGTTKIGEVSDASEHIGTFLIDVYFVALGCTAVIKDVIAAGPILFIGAAIVIGIHCLFLFGVGGAMKLPVDYLIMSSVANIGGPSLGPSVSQGYGWKHMTAPGIVLGLLGYAVGTYLGFAVAYLLKSMLLGA